MTSTLRLIVILTFSFLFACAKSADTTVDTSQTCTPLASSGQSIGTGNVVPVTVGCGYPNEPCVAVKICVPGTNNCQIIDHILLDTGSYGLRLFTCAVSLPLPHQKAAGNELAECVTYADLSADWGPVMLADIYLGSETTSTGAGSTGTPIQIIDPNYAPTFIAKGGCGSPEYSPAVSGFNGIMGIGLFQNDCDSCVLSNNTATAPFYATCANDDCSGHNTLATLQVTNPIFALQQWNNGGNNQTDNNGTILEINGVGGQNGIPNGTTGVTGSLILGLDTGLVGSNNDTSAGNLNITQMYPADATFGVFRADYNGTQYPDSFVDSGSNLWDFPDNGITECSSGDLAGSGIYCPANPVSLQATPYDINVAGPVISFTLSNGALLENGNNAFNNIGAFFGGLGLQGNGPDSFDFGLPFYFGRKVCTGIKGIQDTRRNWGGAAPYWAWK